MPTSHIPIAWAFCSIQIQKYLVRIDLNYGIQSLWMQIHLISTTSRVFLSLGANPAHLMFSIYIWTAIFVNPLKFHLDSQWYKMGGIMDRLHSQMILSRICMRYFIGCASWTFVSHSGVVYFYVSKILSQLDY